MAAKPLRDDPEARRVPGTDDESMRTTTTTSYTLYSGKRVVGVRNAWSPGEAVIEYLRGQGYRRDEIRTMGYESAAWRGAIYTARKTSEQT
jgi:Ni/Co efflux regulator RcnB